MGAKILAIIIGTSIITNFIQWINNGIIKDDKKYWKRECKKARKENKFLMKEILNKE